MLQCTSKLAFDAVSKFVEVASRKGTEEELLMTEAPAPPSQAGKEDSDRLTDYADQIDSILKILGNLYERIGTIDSTLQDHGRILNTLKAEAKKKETRLKNRELKSKEFEAELNKINTELKKLKEERKTHNESKNEGDHNGQNPEETQINDKSTAKMAEDTVSTISQIKPPTDRSELATMRKPIEFWNWNHTKREPFITIDFRCDEMVISFTGDSSRIIWDSEIPIGNGKNFYRLRRGDLVLMDWSPWEPVTGSEILRVYQEKWEIRLPYGI